MKQKLEQAANEDNETLHRLLRRTNLAMLFWREKIIETVSNHRQWRYQIAMNSAISQDYVLVQRRRIRRLVGHAYAEYRRRQADVNMLLSLAARSKRRGGGQDTALRLEFGIGPPKPALRPRKTTVKKAV